MVQVNPCSSLWIPHGSGKGLVKVFCQLLIHRLWHAIPRKSLSTGHKTCLRLRACNSVNKESSQLCKYARCLTSFLIRHSSIPEVQAAFFPSLSSSQRYAYSTAETVISFSKLFWIFSSRELPLLLQNTPS